MARSPWLDRIRSLDPRTQADEIYRLHYHYEFPWDTVQALSFALFRTYAVPSIGGLLSQTGEFTERVQKRYDDTTLLLDTIVEHGLEADEGRAALKRMNWMHAQYDISNDDLRYVLATFVVVPVRWISRFGWRRLTRTELDAMVTNYVRLGRHMGINDLPETFAEFSALLERYEQEHFGYDEGGRAVADATVDLMGTFAPFHLLPRPLYRRVAYALMDEPLLDAFGYPHPTALERALAEGVLRLRGRFVALLPPRRKPYLATDNPNIRSYPNGYRIEDLGSTPVRGVSPGTKGCPVDHVMSVERGA